MTRKSPLCYCYTRTRCPPGEDGREASKEPSHVFLLSHSGVEQRLYRLQWLEYLWTRGPHEHPEVLQHDVAWSRLMSEGILEDFHTMQGSQQSHRSARWWRSLLNIMYQGIPDIFNNVHLWGFRWSMEVSEVRRVFLEPLGSNSRRVGCRIVLLELS
ncbi:hypothetical protein AVEN_54814-1 [Araneus ventricosus]|uniref:Uncharacterized protein n=1 Tax=Araneus ventricosus TaxID=182803 RepID=A0A4Y2EWV4_ARAVE|nr:hypothetical protein AVEN_54814-1 [Araneus ventricosus]